MTRTCALLLGALALFVGGCTGGESFSSGAALPPPDESSDPSPPPVLGSYRLTGDPTEGSLALTPFLRDGAALADSFDIDITLLTAQTFKLVGIQRTNPATLRLSFTWTHPFPDTSARKDLAGFDLRLHLLSNTVLASVAGPAGLNAPTGPGGAAETVRLGGTNVLNADGWSTWGAEVVEPVTGALAPNTYPFVLIHEDFGRNPVNANAPEGWNVVAQSTTSFPFDVDLAFTGATTIDLLLALDASWQSSARANIPEPGPGSRLNPRYLNPNANLKEPWRALAEVSGSLIAGAPSTSTTIQLTAFDHQGSLPAAGNFDALTAPSTSLRYASHLDCALVGIPGLLPDKAILAGASFGGDGSPGNPYTRPYIITGAETTAGPGTYLGVVSFVDAMSVAAGATDPLPTLGYSRDNQIITRRDFATYVPFIVTVDPDTNLAPSAEVVASPNPVEFGGTVQLSPGGGTSDPDGALVLYEYDFNYDGVTFTVDASEPNTTPVTSPSQTLAGTVTMAMRVTDNGVPAKVASDTEIITVNGPANQPPTADLDVSPNPVVEGNTVQLSPGGGTTDPDGVVVLYEYDFDYDGVTFTVDASQATPVAVTSGVLATPGSRTMALRVTDNGVPSLNDIDTVLVTITPAPSASTWTEIHTMIANGDPNSPGVTPCIACHAFGAGGLVMTSNKNTTYNNVVNQLSSCGLDYIEPNQPSNSLIWRKIQPAPPCGLRMPRDGPPYWTQTAIDMVESWILDGAPNN